MERIEAIMKSFYDILLQLKYPDITKAECNDIQFTILSGNNRIALLTWLLATKDLDIASKLEKMKDSKLEDELFKCYSSIGICNNKGILLGNCTIHEQIPFLQHLLTFIQSVHLTSANVNCKDVTPIDISKICINDDTNVSGLGNIRKKMSYEEAKQYFTNIQKELNDGEEEQDNAEKKEEDNAEIKEEFSVFNLNQLIEGRNKQQGTDQEVAFRTEKENFIAAFGSVKSWPTGSKGVDREDSMYMDNDIENMCSNFAILEQILQARDEIAKINIPKEISKFDTPLRLIMEDTVICSEELKNMCTNGTILD